MIKWLPVLLLLAVPAHADLLLTGAGGAPSTTCGPATYGYVASTLTTFTLTVPPNCTTAVMAIWAPGASGSVGITTRGGSGASSGDYDQAGTFGSATNPITGLTPGATLYVTIVGRGAGTENCISSATGCTGTVYVYGYGGTASNTPPSNAGGCSIANCTTIIGLAGGTAAAAGAAGGGSAPGGPGASTGLAGGAGTASKTGGAGGAGAYGSSATAGTAASGTNGAAGGEGFAGTGAGAGGTSGAGGAGTNGGGGGGGLGGGTNNGGAGAQYVVFTATYPSSLAVGPGGGGGGGGNDLTVGTGGAGGAGGDCGSGGGGGGGGTTGGAAGVGGRGCIYISFPD